jgi:microcystin-dependent protein
MSDPFVAEIRIFAGNFAPTGWAMCDGQILSISQNTALFSLLGTTYGGNGQSTFALPDLQGRAPMHPGQNVPGLSDTFLGEEAGEEALTLLQTQIPAHTHDSPVPSFRSFGSDVGDNKTPTGLIYAKDGLGQTAIFGTGASNTTMSPNMLQLTGGSLPHNNMQPYLVLNFIIALQGVFPPRN